MDNRKFLYIAVSGFLIFVILIVVLVLVDNRNQKNKNKENSLVFWNLDDDETAFKSIIEKFEEGNANIKITYVKKDQSEYLSSVLEKLAAGEGPDILALPHDWLPKYHNLLSPMPEGKISDSKRKKSDTEIYKEIFADVAGKDNIIDGKIYGFPLSIDTLQLYYNPAIFDEAISEYRKTQSDAPDDLRKAFQNGPKNWDELAQIVPILTKKSGLEINRSAIALGSGTNIADAADILTLMMLQNGAKMTSDDQSTALFHTKENHLPEFASVQYPGTKALEFYASFSNPKSPNYTWNEEMPEAVRAFAEGKTAMLIGYSSQASEIKRISPDFDFTTINVPQVKESAAPINYASYNTYAVRRDSASAALAWDFIIFATGKDSSSEYLEITKKTSAHLDRLSDDSPVRTAQSWYKPDPVKANNIFISLIREVSAGQSAQTALDGAAAGITNLLGELKQ